MNLNEVTIIPKPYRLPSRSLGSGFTVQSVPEGELISSAARAFNLDLCFAFFLDPQCTSIEGFMVSIRC